MSIIAAELIANVSVTGAARAASELAGMGAATDSAGGRLAALATGAAVLGSAALIGIGVATTKMAADFQQGVNRLKTGGGDIQDSFKSLWTGIQKVADATGVLTGPLTDAMYLIVSAGQRGAQAFATLTAAAQGAQIEQAKVADVTQILTTLQSNFGIATYTAAQYMDGLVSAVSHGKITLEALSTAMSPILPMAHELGIHFADVSAAMSDMTNQGVPADQAATALRFTFQSMILPTKASQKAMQEWGLDSAKVAETMKTSLPDALQMYIDAAKRAGPEGSKPFIDALSSMMGGGQRAAKALFSLDQTMNTWRGDIKDVNAAMGDTSKNVSGWDTAQSNLNVKLQEGLANLQTLGQNVGMVILPYVSQLVDQIGPLTQRFQEWFVTSGREATVLKDIGSAMSTLGNVIGAVVPIIGNIAGAFTDAGTTGTILRGALIALGIAFATVKLTEFINGIIGTISFLKDLIPVIWATEAATIGLVGAFALVAAAIVGAGVIAMNWDHIMEATSTYTADRSREIGQGFSNLGTLVQRSFKAMEDGVSLFAGAYSGNQTALGTISTQIGRDFSALGAKTHDAWTSITNAVSDATTTVKQKTSDMTNAVDQQVRYMHDHVTSDANGMKDSVANSAQAMYDAATQKAQQMAINVAASALNMQQLVVRDVSVTESTASNLVSQLKDSVIGDFSSMDSLAKGYWDDVANYILDNPIQGYVNINVAGSPAPKSATVQAHAEGTSYAPGGWSWVGERGPEMMYVPRGAQIIPHTQSVGGGSPGGAGGSPIQVNINIAGHNVARVLLPELVTAIRNGVGTVGI